MKNGDGVRAGVGRRETERKKGSVSKESAKEHEISRQKGREEDGRVKTGREAG